jgi:pimeloyl-ACP methyl ester carboxylesterase
LRELLLGVSGTRLGWVGEAGRAYEQVTRSLGIELLLPARTARRIRELSCPVQAICGARDPVFSAAPWQTLQRLRPDWEYVTLDDVGHVPQLEAPAEVARCISRWALRVAHQKREDT